MLFYLGCICILGGLYFLLVNLKIISKSTSIESQKPIEAQRIDNFLIRLFSIITCLIGFYFIYSSMDHAKQRNSIILNEQVKSNPKEDIKYWDAAMKQALTNQCLENGKRTAEEYPDLVKEYCNCATDKIAESMSPEEYTQIITKPKEEQAITIRPLVQTCVDILTRLIQLSQEAKPEINKSK
ncbi:MAG: hypothetical protein IPO86_13545 [Saprospiraceae bacterium]|nr:hypothetical protein [Saprospiraceae bacterium]MBK9221066.1 hypothetical protein [Saprospiraceae bacterium]MBK9729129.1 hypothetical protein [Saprospiraceae bacterium]